MVLYHNVMYGIHNELILVHLVCNEHMQYLWSHGLDEHG